MKSSYRIDTSRVNTLLLNLDSDLKLDDFYNSSKGDCNYVLNMTDYLKSQLNCFLSKDYSRYRNTNEYSLCLNFINTSSTKGVQNFLKVYRYFTSDIALVQLNLLSCNRCINVIQSLPVSVIKGINVSILSYSELECKLDRESLFYVNNSIVYDYLDNLLNSNLEMKSSERDDLDLKKLLSLFLEDNQSIGINLLDSYNILHGDDNGKKYVLAKALLLKYVSHKGYNLLIDERALVQDF